MAKSKSSSSKPKSEQDSSLEPTPSAPPPEPETPPMPEPEPEPWKPQPEPSLRIPIRNVGSLSDNFEELGQDILNLLKNEFKMFIENNGDLVQILGEDVVDSILTFSLFRELPMGISLPENASPQDIAAQELINAVRTEAFAVMAKAELEHKMTVQEARKRSIVFMKGISFSVIGMLLKALIPLAS